MKRGVDISVKFPGLYLIHHNLPGQDVDEHTHEDEHQLIIVLQGEVALKLSGGTTLRAGAGRSAYLPPGCAHAFLSTNEAQGERLIAHISNGLWAQAGGANLDPAVFPSPALCHELLFFLLLHKETRHAEGLAAAVVLALSETLATRGSGTLAGDEALDHLIARVSDERVRKAVTFVRDNALEDIPLASIAKASGLSERNLSRLFAAETGLTPKQLQTRVRIDEARQMLSKKHTSVTEVAFAVGYSSLSLFIAAFRNVTGQVPSLWRENSGG